MSNQFENVIKEFDKYSYYTEGKISRGIEEHRKGQFALLFTRACIFSSRDPCPLGPRAVTQ